ncbi:MAG: glycosyltransferase [Planctomycetaceae bacterium]
MVIGPTVASLNRWPGVVAEVATTDADGPGGRLSACSLPVHADCVHLFRRTFSERWKYSGDLWRWLQCHVADYDLLHIHSLWSFASAAAASAARRAGVPYIVRPAGMLSPYSWGRGVWHKRLYWSLAERATVHGAVGFHVTSEDEAAEVRAVRTDARTFVIPNGVDDGAWTAGTNQTELRRRCGERAGNRPLVLFLSRLHPKKGITDLLLPAMARLKSDAFLALVGGTDPHAPGYDAEVISAIDRLGLNDRVAMLGPVAVKERWQLFDGADVFVLPSWSENFGVVVAEAMARKCPVVVTEGVHSRTIVAAAGAGRIVRPDPGDIAAALDDLVADPDSRARMGCRGREYIETHLGWESIARSLVSAYQECLSRSS